ncbi:FAD linked oxidase domain-containing protein [Mycobacteroides abscessus]|nr:FAD linked oxidase domain-containing protein [Mycobacteroides abscessus]
MRGFRVVLADGSVVEAGPDTEPDLFWALRGGKGGLGVVTRLDLELVPLRTLYAGSLTFDAPHVEDVLRGWAAWTATAPDDVTTSVAVLALPDLPFVPEHLRGRTVLALRFAYPGDPAEGERLAAPLRALAPALADTVGELPVTAVATIHARTRRTPGRRGSTARACGRSTGTSSTGSSPSSGRAAGRRSSRPSCGTSAAPGRATSRAGPPRAAVPPGSC